MAEHVLRFAVSDGAGMRAATWRCWAPAGVGKNDVYLSCREVGAAFKASLHESGSWHIAFDQAFFEANVQDEDRTDKGRFLDAWPRPAEIGPGVTLAFRIVTSWASVNTPITESEAAKLTLIPNASKGMATEVGIVLTNDGSKTSGWPGKRGMNNELIGSLQLDCGDSVWAVSREIDMPAPRSFRAPTRYFRGMTEHDLRSATNLRMLMFGNESDGSRTIYDYIGGFDESGS